MKIYEIIKNLEKYNIIASQLGIEGEKQLQVILFNGILVITTNSLKDLKKQLKMELVPDSLKAIENLEFIKNKEDFTAEFKNEIITIIIK